MTLYVANLDESICLKFDDIKSIAVAKGFGAKNDEMFALMAYPTPGAGYKIGLFNDRIEAENEFQKLMTWLTASEKETKTWPTASEKETNIYLVASKYEEPAEEVIDEIVIEETDLELE